MASLAQGIVGGDMAWPLIVAGILMGIAMILIGVLEPHAGRHRHVPSGRHHLRDLRRRHGALGQDTHRGTRGLNEAQKARVEMRGVLAASGMIAGEALMGLVTSGYQPGR